MPKRTGYADLPLHHGTVPHWLADRMRDLGTQIIESLILNYGRKEVLVRLSDPLWFQSFGAVLGMDWHSSGITTSVMYALKRGLNPRAHELGIAVCGGRGKYSRQTPDQLKYLGDACKMDSSALINASRLCAKVDNNALQDGFNLYQHNFILTSDGDWAVVQQGMNVETKSARRYHWCSTNLRSFVEEPHTGVVGENKGQILNLTDVNACNTKKSILKLTNDSPDKIMHEVKQIVNPSASIIVQGELFDSPKSQEIIIENSRNLYMPRHHELRAEDVDLKRLGAVLAIAYESEIKDFESLLLTPGLGPRTLQSLTLVSEIIFGSPSRFSDPARFSFAHGGKDGHPFPVPLKIYDESIRILGDSIEKAKLNFDDKSKCLKRLYETQLSVEKNCLPQADFEKTLEWERKNSRQWGGRTVMDK